MVPTGQKRKLLPEEEGEALGWSVPALESQRQFVFTVSLLKYQHSLELAEPSLRRSVLIANTLRQVSGAAPSAGAEESQPPSTVVVALQEREAHTFAAEAPERTPPGAADGVHAAGLDLSSEGPPSRSAPRSRWGPSQTPVDEEDWGSMATDPDFEVETAIASILCSLDSTMEGGHQAAPRAPLRSLENLVELSEGGASWEKQGGDSVSWEQGSSVEVLRSSYLSDVTVEDLFQDIDTSLMETDVEVLGVRSGAGDELLRYLPPLNASADCFTIALNPGLKCLPAFSSFIPSYSSSSSSSSSASSSSASFDLEHLMKVLVES